VSLGPDLEHFMFQPIYFTRIYQSEICEEK
jgi:hypothetical protein